MSDKTLSETLNEISEAHARWPQKEKLQYRGLHFTIERDRPGRLHEIGVCHEFHCHSSWVTVGAYGRDRLVALSSALAEIYDLVKSHHAACAICRMCIVYNLIGEDENGEETNACD